ncbi:MFS transporter [Actinokineospora fastidiosa]|nr:MFS transporter [Actinokineospora fastidiosa]
MGRVMRSGSPDQPPRRPKRGRKGWTDAPQPAWRPADPPPRNRPTRPYERQDEPEFETFGDRYPNDYPPRRPRPPWRDDRYADRYDAPRGWAGPPRSREQHHHEGPYRDDPYRDDPYREDPYRDGPYRDDERPRYDERHRDEPPRHPDDPAERPTDEVPGAPRFPKKLTVTRVAALRSRQLTTQAVSAFRRAAGADGAEKSGLTALTYATMLNYASDAAMAVALANTLFFSAASGESRGKVALYLLITVAPFALIAPVIGPALDRIQRGRRLAMSAVSAGQALMCLIMALNFDTWLLYPAALGKMVLSKSFTVLKAAVTPRVLPQEITLAKTNARLTVFGLFAGAVFGGIGAAFAAPFGSAGALWFTVVISAVGAVQALRIPAWVEVTEGEVPASIKAHPGKGRRQPMGRHIVVSLWGNGTIRVLTGFLMMFAAFAVRAEYEAEPFQQVLLLGVIAAAAGIGSFVGNAIGARVHVGKPEQVVIGCAFAALTSTVVATFAAGITTAAIVGLVGAIASALAKNSLDAVIQDDLPEESRASGFGRSETVLQLSWVFGGAVGVLLPPTWWLGFLVVSVLLAVGIAQTLLSRRGQSLIPGLGGDRPIRPDQTSEHPIPRSAGWRPATLHEGPPNPAP